MTKSKRVEVLSTKGYVSIAVDEIKEILCMGEIKHKITFKSSPNEIIVELTHGEVMNKFGIEPKSETTT